MILFSHIINHFLIFTLPIIILFIRVDLNLNYAQSAVPYTVMILMMSFFSFFIGIYADDHRNKRYPIMFLSLVLVVTGYFLITLVHSFLQMILVFAFIGFGASGFHPPAMAIITEMYENDKGKALSAFQVVGMAGNAISPLIFAGIQILTNEWQITLLIYAACLSIFILIVIILSLIRGMLKRIEWEGQKIDTSDVVKTKNNGKNIGFLTSALILVPLLFISIRTSFLRTTTLFTSLLYTDYLNLTETDSIIATAIVLGFASMFVVVGGTISDKTKPRISIVISIIGTLVGAIGLVFFTNYHNLINFSAFYFILNAFYYIGSPAASALLANRVDSKQRGKLFGAFFSVGQILSLATPIIFGWIKDNYGLRPAFTFIMALASLAFIIGFYIYFEEKNRKKN